MLQILTKKQYCVNNLFVTKFDPQLPKTEGIEWFEKKFDTTFGKKSCFKKWQGAGWAGAE